MSGRASKPQTADVWAWLVAFAVFTVAFIVSADGVLAPVSERLFEWGFSTLKRPASGQVVVIQIDARSVSEIGAWPWPRKTYAKAIDILHEAGASTIALDVDLPPVPAVQPGDALVRAVIRAKGSVVFRPDPRSSSAESFAARVANVLPGSLHTAEVDYSIDPGSIPRLSFLDVYDANIDFTKLKGKRVIIGVTASRLGERVVVPGHGELARTELDALMVESLVQDRRLSRAGLAGQALVAMFTVLFMWPGGRSWTLDDLVVPSVAAMWGAVVFAALVFEYADVLLDPMPSAVVVAGCVGFSGLRALARQIVLVIRENSRGSAWRALADLLDDERPDRIVVMRKPTKP